MTPQKQQLLTRQIVADAYPERRLLTILHGSLKLALLPLWETADVVPRRVCLVWGRDPRDVWLTDVSALAGSKLLPDDEMVVEPLELNKRYENPVRRAEVLAVCARLELVCRLGYTTGEKVALGLAMRERLFRAAKIGEIPPGHPRGARFPQKAFRSYRVDRVSWAEIPSALQRWATLRWIPDVGYVAEGLEP